MERFGKQYNGKQLISIPVEQKRKKLKMMRHYSKSIMKLKVYIFRYVVLNVCYIIQSESWKSSKYTTCVFLVFLGVYITAE